MRITFTKPDSSDGFRVVGAKGSSPEKVLVLPKIRTWKGWLGVGFGATLLMGALAPDPTPPIVENVSSTSFSAHAPAHARGEAPASPTPTVTVTATRTIVVTHTVKPKAPKAKPKPRPTLNCPEGITIEKDTGAIFCDG